MDSDTKRMVNIAVAWCGPVFVLGYIIFWAMLGHNVPPPNVMGMTPEQLVSEYYGKYQSEISVGMIGCCVVGLIYTPWSLLLASMLRDDDGQLGRPCAVCHRGGGRCVADFRSQRRQRRCCRWRR